MEKEKMEIGYRIKKEVDFGNLREDCRAGTIKVNKTWWHGYVKKRKEFEMLHVCLLTKLPQKYFDKLQASELPIIRTRRQKDWTPAEELFEF